MVLEEIKKLVKEACLGKEDILKLIRNYELIKSVLYILIHKKLVILFLN